MDARIEIANATVIVDEADLPLIAHGTWWLTDSGYARGYFPKTDDQPDRTIFMHRLILGLAPDDPRDGDHINGVRLDNRRSNLRICSHRENCWNTAVSSRNTSGYKGVSFDRRRNRWHARIRVHGKVESLGHHATPEAAYAVYCEAAKKHFGEFARI